MEKTYQNAIDLLTSQGKFYINLGLDRIKAVLELWGNPQSQLKCIHVAGTNGKGSTCAILSTILTEAGFKTGLYSSPHVFEYTERIKIDGIEIPQTIFAEKIFEIQEISEKNEIHLTEFEILTAVMFKYFAENKVDYVVLETGLGGRFDATNIIENPVCSVITRIDFDHIERLGEEIEKIAFEKAGIIKPNCPVIAFKDNLGIDVIKKTAGENLIYANNYQFKELSLKGIYQQENLSLALSVLSLIMPNIKMGIVSNAVQKVQHPCRFEIINDVNLIVDGAHNPSGIKGLRESLENYYPNQNYRFIFGCLKNKKYKEMLKLLLKQGDEIYFYHFNNPNSATFQELNKACEFETKEFTKFEPSEKITVICGSFYMIKELLERIKLSLNQD